MGVAGSSSWEEVWAWWSGLANFETRAALPGELKLGRMLALMEALGNPHLLPRIVHVTGTKGKGSTSAMIESVLRHAGFRTALYSSPHLNHVTERFLLDGAPVSREDLATAVTQVRGVVESAGLPEVSKPILTLGPPTFFEVATAAAFLLFAEKKTEFVVLEVGLGGRLDSTNICVPECSVITTVGLDHTKILGETVEKIATEKAGIIKPGIPVVSGVFAEPARAIIRQTALDAKSILWELGREIVYQGMEAPWWKEGVFQRVNVRTPLAEYPGLPCPLAGKHQWQNLACAVGALDLVLSKFVSSRGELMKRGLGATQWPGRLEVLGRDPLLIFDGAHNLDSAAVLATEIGQIPLRGKRRMVIAISSDKDQSAILGQLAPLADVIYLTRYASGQRATSPEFLATCLPKWFTGQIHVVDSPIVAMNLARESSGPEDLILVTGSLFLVGELRMETAGSYYGPV